VVKCNVKNKEEMMIEEKAGKKRKELGYELHVGGRGKEICKNIRRNGVVC
jgi:hypothetical protein